MDTETEVLQRVNYIGGRCSFHSFSLEREGVRAREHTLAIRPTNSKSNRATNEALKLFWRRILSNKNSVIT